MMHRSPSSHVQGLIIALLVGFYSLSPFCRSAQAQIEPPDRKFVFFEDKDKKKKASDERKAERAKEGQRKDLEKKDLPLDVKAPVINLDSNKNKLNAEGGLLLHYSTAIVEAEKGTFDLETHDADLWGDVRVSDPTGSISADTAHLNLKEKTGILTNTDMFFEDGNYRIHATQAEKFSGELYSFENATMSSCECPAGNAILPWKLTAPEAKITRNGYGQAWNASFDVCDIPVLFTPYIVFPVKTDRQSGFLPATFGYGKTHGFELKLPFFWDIDESTDATITGILETRVRAGTDVEFRKVFSDYNRLQFGVTYFDESARKGRLFGTTTEGIFDPSIDTNRYEGYLKQLWNSSIATTPVQLILDGRYVSDNLLLREFENERIGERTQNFITSRGVIRSNIFDTYTAELATEYNQVFNTDQDFTFQHLPELSLNGFHVLHPFGENPLGAKLVLENNLNATHFVRNKSFEGIREEAFENFKVPFHVGNYFDGDVQPSIRVSRYDLTDNKQLNFDATGNQVASTVFENTSDRVVPGFNGKLGTAFERVFEVSKDSVFKEIAELGAQGRAEQLVRLKHTIEPEVNYLFVPRVVQDENPLFDGLDHLAHKNVVTYQLTQRLFARYNPRDEYIYGIEEATPDVRDLGSLLSTSPLDERYSWGSSELFGGRLVPVTLRKGSLKELVTLSLKQSYDIGAQRSDALDAPDPFSDFQVGLSLYPNEYVAMHAGTQYNVKQGRVKQFQVENQLRDKRGDELRLYFSFVENPVSQQAEARQIESNLNVRLSERFKLGYYTRYDGIAGEFLENRIGLRISSACHQCWVFDILYSELLNPNETKVGFNIVLAGLGEFGNTLFTEKNSTQ